MPKKQTSPAALPPLPREHGAWAMFLVPLVIGLGVGYSRSTISNSSNTGMVLLLFWLTALGFFLVRYPLMSVFKIRDLSAQGDAIYWSGIYGSVALVGGVALVLMTQLWWLAILGLLGGVFLVAYLWLAVQRKETSVIGEWTAIAGAALTAPSAYLAITYSFNLTALMLYFLNVLFFGGTVYYIKFKVREQPRVTTVMSDRRTRLLAARAPIIYSLVSLITVAILFLGGWLPTLAFIAMWVPVPKILIGALERPIHVNMPRLGMIEIVHSVVFMLLVLWAFRW